MDPNIHRGVHLVNYGLATEAVETGVSRARELADEDPRSLPKCRRTSKMLEGLLRGWKRGEKSEEVGATTGLDAD